MARKRRRGLGAADGESCPGVWKTEGDCTAAKALRDKFKAEGKAECVAEVMDSAREVSLCRWAMNPAQKTKACDRLKCSVDGYRGTEKEYRVKDLLKEIEKLGCDDSFPKCAEPEVFVPEPARSSVSKWKVGLVAAGVLTFLYLTK